MRVAKVVQATILFSLLAGGGTWAGIEIGLRMFPNPVIGVYILPALIGAAIAVFALPFGLLFTGFMTFFIRNDIASLPTGRLLYLFTAILLIAPLTIVLFELEMSTYRPVLGALLHAEYVDPNLLRNTYGSVWLHTLLTTVPAAVMTTFWLTRDTERRNVFIDTSN